MRRFRGDEGEAQRRAEEKIQEKKIHYQYQYFDLLHTLSDARQLEYFRQFIYAE